VCYKNTNQSVFSSKYLRLVIFHKRILFNFLLTVVSSRAMKIMFYNPQENSEISSRILKLCIFQEKLPSLLSVFVFLTIGT